MAKLETHTAPAPSKTSVQPPAQRAAEQGVAVPQVEPTPVHERLDPRLHGQQNGYQRARMVQQMQRTLGNAQVQRFLGSPMRSGLQAPLQPTVALQRETATTSEAIPQAPTEVEKAAARPSAVRAEAAPLIVAPQPTQRQDTAPAPQIRRQSAVQRGLGDLVGSVFNAVKQTALRAVSGLARNLPGYHVLTLVLGRDPITDQNVARTPVNIFQAVLSLVPGGNVIFENLNESGAVDKAFGWLEQQFTQLGLNEGAIRSLFQRTWNTLGSGDLLNPSGAWERVRGIFAEPVSRLRNFVGAIGEKVKEFIFEGVLERLGGGQVLGMLRQAGGAFQQIFRNPVGFLGNLVRGVRLGLSGFMSNIGTHLRGGLLSWLFGELARGGIEAPRSFDLRGILTLMMQVLGLMWQAIRAQAARVLGERTVGTLERSFRLFMIIREQGIGGLWEMIQEQLGNLRETVMTGVRELVVTQVIQSGIQWLMGVLAGPAGAIIQTIRSIYNIVMWLVNNGSRLAALVNSVGQSIGAIASGAVGQAAGFIEQSLARAVPVVIGFLASLLGLGNLSQRIRGVIERVQQPVRRAVGWVLERARGFATRVMGRVRGVSGKKDKPDTRTETQKKAAVDAAIADSEKVLGEENVTPNEVKTKLPAIKDKHKLTSVELVQESGNKYHVNAVISRSSTRAYDLREKGKSFKLASGGLQSHEGQILEGTSGKIIHLYTRHGANVNEATMRDRLEQMILNFENARKAKIDDLSRKIDSARKQLRRLNTNKPENVKALTSWHEDLEKQKNIIQDANIKTQQLRSIDKHDKDAVFTAMREWKVTPMPTDIVTKFRNNRQMERLILDTLEKNQSAIDTAFLDNQGKAKPNGTSLKLTKGIPPTMMPWYELDSQNQVVRMHGTLRQVEMIIRISNRSKFEYMVETAYLRP